MTRDIIIKEDKEMLISEKDGEACFNANIGGFNSTVILNLNFDVNVSYISMDYINGFFKMILATCGVNFIRTNVTLSGNTYVVERIKKYLKS